MIFDITEFETQSLLPSIVGMGFTDPYPIYATLRRERPLSRDISGVWLATSHAVVTQILNDRRFSARILRDETSIDPFDYSDIILYRTGEDHQRLRQLFAPLFARGALVALQAFIDAEVERLLGRLDGVARFDLVGEIASVLPVRVTCRLLGFPDSFDASYLAGSSSVWQLISRAQLPAAEYRRMILQTEAFLAEIEAGIDRLAADPASTHPAARLAQLARDAHIEPREMLVNVLFLFIAGYGTTMLSIANSVAAALRAPSAWAALRADEALVPQAVRELTRYDAAAQAVTRYAWEDATIDGQPIRRGERITVLLGAANRDPAEFDMPDEIRFTRTEGRALTFGAGPHGCMGVALARMQLDALLRAMIRRMPDLRLAAGSQRRRQYGSLHGYHELWLERG